LATKNPLINFYLLAAATRVAKTRNLFIMTNDFLFFLKTIKLEFQMKKMATKFLDINSNSNIIFDSIFFLSWSSIQITSPIVFNKLPNFFGGTLTFVNSLLLLIVSQTILICYKNITRTFRKLFFLYRASYFLLFP
jgi:hypothetical protein